MELLLGLVCDDARTTPEGKLDVEGVFNDLFAPGFPARQDRMVLVMAVEWDRDDQGRFKFRIDLTGPEGDRSLTVDGHTDVDPRPAHRPPPRTRLVMPLENVVFPRPGRYRFQVRMKGETLPGPSLHLIRREDAPDDSGPDDAGADDAPAEPEPKDADPEPSEET